MTQEFVKGGRHRVPAAQGDVPVRRPPAELLHGLGPELVEAAKGLKNRVEVLDELFVNACAGGEVS